MVVGCWLGNLGVNRDFQTHSFFGNSPWTGKNRENTDENPSKNRKITKKTGNIHHETIKSHGKRPWTVCDAAPHRHQVRGRRLPCRHQPRRRCPPWPSCFGRHRAWKGQLRPCYVCWFIWLVVTGTWLDYDFPSGRREWNNHPNWRSPSFFRGVGIPPTSYRTNSNYIFLIVIVCYPYDLLP